MTLHLHRLIIAGLVLTGTAVIVLWGDVYMMQVEKQHRQMQVSVPMSGTHQGLISKTN